MDGDRVRSSELSILVDKTLETQRRVCLTVSTVEIRGQAHFLVQHALADEPACREYCRWPLPSSCRPLLSPERPALRCSAIRPCWAVP